MREFLMAYGLPVIWALTVAETAIGVLCLRKSKSAASRLSAALSFGLAVDALIQAIGVLLGEGTLLQGISQVRYILHGILVPLLLPISFEVYGVKSSLVRRIVWIATGVLVVGGVAAGVLTRTEPVQLAGVLRYASSKETPAFAHTFDSMLSIGGVIPLIAVGLVHVIRHKKPWLLLSGIAMFAFAALAPATHNMDLNFLLTMFGEALMVGFLWAEG